jgi:hypothetical protein
MNKLTFFWQLGPTLNLEITGKFSYLFFNKFDDSEIVGNNLLETNRHIKQQICMYVVIVNGVWTDV